MVPSTPLSQADTIADIASPNDFGSICCAVISERNPAFVGIVTSAHLYTQGNFIDTNNTFLTLPAVNNVILNKQPVGKWLYKQLTSSQDLIIVQLDQGIALGDIQGLKRFNNQYYTVQDTDVSVKQVTVLSKGGKQTQGWILANNVTHSVTYNNGSFEKTNVILIGSTANSSTSKPVSVYGDSGSAVYINDNGIDKMVGILVGADANFTIVVPIQETLAFGFNIA
jgi:hypothetical protein